MIEERLSLCGDCSVTGSLPQWRLVVNPGQKEKKNMSNEFTDIGVPEKMQISKNFQQLRIVRKWFGFKFVFLTLFVIIWDAFLVNWYAMAFSSSFQSAFDLMFFLFPLIHVAVGIGLTYYVLTDSTERSRFYWAKAGLKTSAGFNTRVKKRRAKAKKEGARVSGAQPCGFWTVFSRISACNLACR